MSDSPDDMLAQRSDIIGGTFALKADGTFVNTVAFTDEVSARDGEASSGGPPAELASLMSDLTFYDLRDPWFVSA